MNLQPGLLGPHIEPLRVRIRMLLEAGEHSVADVAKRIRLLHLAARPVEPGHFPVIADALLARKRLAVRHHNRKTGETLERELSPQRLVYYRDNWYLDAWCHLRGDLRSFSLDAFERVAALERRARDVSERKLNAQLGAGYRIFGGEPAHRAVLRFTPERARHGERLAVRMLTVGLGLVPASLALRQRLLLDLGVLLERAGASERTGIAGFFVRTHAGLESRALTPPERERLDYGCLAALTALGRLEECNRFFWRAAIPRAREPALLTTALSKVDRYRGALLGLAAGDALGTTLELSSPGTFEPLTDLVGGGPFALAPGQWTDDTSMALCLAESLVECRGFDPGDQMHRYLRWYREGYLSSTGRCFDIGSTVGAALRRFEQTGNPFAGDTAPHAGGNGSLMRLAPVPLAFAQDPERAIHTAGEMSRTTHGAPEPVDACRYFAGLLAGALAGEDRETLLSPRYSPVPGLWARAPLAPRIDAVAAGSFQSKDPPAIRGTGYVVAALEAALWAFAKSRTFEEGALLAVNLGDDADTTGAIYGQLAGAHYGVEAIPARWRARLALRERIAALTEGLPALAETGRSATP